MSIPKNQDRDIAVALLIALVVTILLMTKNEIVLVWLIGLVALGVGLMIAFVWIYDQVMARRKSARSAR